MIITISKLVLLLGRTLSITDLKRNGAGNCISAMIPKIIYKDVKEPGATLTNVNNFLSKEKEYNKLVSEDLFLSVLGSMNFIL